ncbi:MAG: hypothetical protein L6Q98_14570 [Anaerolineae bacterium]|nr:hypothetical protein [Anaerolineae bacterium]NUQ04173.1 hypothetical protein [Anaerolineae bacterium]
MLQRHTRTFIPFALLFIVLFSAAAAVGQQPSTPRVEIYTSKIPFGETYVYRFIAAEGDQVTITARSVDGDFDPRVTLVSEAGQFLAANDDAVIPDPALRGSDARIEGIMLPETGGYIIEISGVQGVGGTVELTIDWLVDQMFTLRRQEAIAYQLRNPISSELSVVEVYPYDRSLYVFDARRGEVYSFYARALSGDIDPQLSVYYEDTELIDANDDHGSTDPSLGPGDARIPNLIIDRDGRYFVEVRGYAGTQGSIGFTVVHVMNGALAYPGTETEIEDSVAPDEFKHYDLDLRVGDFVSITVQARSSLLDPFAALLDADGAVLIDNDNHGYNDADIDFFDARIKNYLIAEPGSYSVMVGSARGGEGSYTLTVNIKRDRRLFNESYTPPPFNGG